jgi:hypothetical protein
LIFHFISFILTCVLNTKIYHFYSAFTTNISETTNTDKITVYPNPTNSTFVIDYDKAGLIKLYDMLGKEVLNQTFNGKTEININHLHSGIYFVNVISEGKIVGNSKILKQ